MSPAEFTSDPDMHGAAPAWLAAQPVSAALPPPHPVLPPPLPPMPSRNYFLRHWRGECELAVAWWVNCFIGTIVCAIALVIFFFAVGDMLAVRMLATFWVFGTIYTLLALITVWQLIGVWRSATNYRAGGKRFWGALAKCAVLLIAGSSVWNAATVVGPELTEMYRIAHGDPDIGPHQFAVTDNGATLKFSGGITHGVASELEQRLAAMDHVTTVELNSDGGRVAEAERMANVIKARSLATKVTEKCLSACPTALLGGRERILVGNAKIGFHQPSFGRRSAAVLLAAEEDRLVRLGLSREFAKRTNQPKPEDMWYPDHDELLREHVVTKIVDAGQGSPLEVMDKSDEKPADAKPVTTRGLQRAAGE